MLLDLRMRGLGAIDDVTLTLGDGFTAITGETGAGKTMLLTGLALLLGGRADAGLVRQGHPRVEVEGRFRVPETGPIAELVRDAGGDLDGDELLIVRTIGTDGRSRAHLGGRSVPVSTLSALAEDLVSVHGQSDQRGLLRASVQRGVLDSYAGDAVSGPLATYRERFADLTAVQHELAAVTGHRRERVTQADALRHGLADIDAAAPAAGEDVALRDELRRLSHVDALQRSASVAHQLLSGITATDPGDQDALSRISAARHELETAAGHDAALDALATRLAEASYLLADLAADLGGYSDGLDADPLRLAAIHDRLAVFGGLTRRYGDTIDEVLAWAEQARERLTDLDDDDSRVQQLTERRDALLQQLTDSATELSDARRAAATRLSQAVGAELEGLAMPNASLVVAVRRRPDPHGLVVEGDPVAFGQWGVDDVELQLVPHAGAPARPLHKGASGGELSRVMLALEIVLAGADPVSCFVFDEVDAGVGGRAAVEVGRRLAGLARTAQVVVVTHLPQVAAFADHHVVVARSERDHIVSSDVEVVDGEGRLRELSRMLAGLEDSASARDHAEELLATATAAKSTVG
ncbi:MAG TPA: DNA repair protein RecN [Mycobacteriales bacterium]|nr:DNA repair protein RecN [Mycobacteriales bacterium]